MKTLRNIIQSDFRALGNAANKNIFLEYVNNKCFRFIFWFRVTKLLKQKNKILYLFSRLIYSRLKIKYSIDLPINTKIGTGFVIFHGMGVVINSDVIIGNNVTILHNVTLGINKTGGGCPTIGNNVMISPGSILLGPIEIGDNVTIGAGSIITKSVPKDAIVVGNPFKIIKYK